MISLAIALTPGRMFYMERTHLQTVLDNIKDSTEVHVRIGKTGSPLKPIKGNTREETIRNLKQYLSLLSKSRKIKLLDSPAEFASLLGED